MTMNLQLLAAAAAAEGPVVLGGADLNKNNKTA
jgi:hypothetical protein